ncbi:transglutaminase domain-containing protein [Cohnella silvisoli]|uniref:Transglutaminase domain-containing protein n=1 Tax=Cohnella silvisoli TaxID=2873699 RepID=A0ABV1KR21_9BACL|nr:transglutaminase domain-containing protein [Cohnella silvisoli]MCD9022091.1 hypothetical protein [Cohnella silvisoli]
MNYLTSSNVIDYDHAVIDDLFDELNTDNSDATFVKNAFHFVRDSIQFEFSPFEDKISDTAIKKKGQCYHKTNLLVGLCRKKGIKAGIKYSIIDIQVMEPVFSEEILELFKSEPIGHFFPAIMIEGEWVSVDPMFDTELLEYSNRLNWDNAKDWDGNQFAKLPESLILSEQSEVLESAFKENEIPHNPIVDKMNERLKSIRNGIAK